MARQLLSNKKIAFKSIHNKEIKMNKLPTKRVICVLLVLLALLFSACGTFQIEAELSASDGLTTGSATSNVEPTLVDVAMTTDAIQEVQVAEQVAPATHIIMTATVARNTPNREELFLPGCYDFDAGASLTPPDPGCDFTFLPGPDSGTIEIYPVAPAQLAYGAVIPEEPDPAECAENGAFSTEPGVLHTSGSLLWLQGVGSADLLSHPLGQLNGRKWPLEREKCYLILQDRGLDKILLAKSKWSE